MSRAVVYCRVSTDAQERDGTSLDTQEAACREYARSCGWQVFDCVREAGSGASLSRPGLERARELLRTRRADVLLAFDVDRLSREQLGVGLIAAEAQDYHYRLEFVQDKFEDTAVGRYLLSTKAFVAELEREKIAERTKRGKGQRAKAGKLPQATGKGMYGYLYNPTTGHRMENREQSAIVRRIFAEFTSGLGVSAIANGLNRDGIAAFGGGPWHAMTVRRCLQNESYTGETIYRRTRAIVVKNPVTGEKRRQIVERDSTEWIRIEGATPALISKEVFERAKLIFADPVRQRRGRPSKWYKLTGRMRCAACATPMVGQVLKRGEYAYSYYRCRNSYTSLAGPKCPARYVRSDTLEKAVLDTIIDVMVDPQRLRSEVLNHYRSAQPRADVEIIQKQLKRIVQQQGKLIMLTLESDLPRDQLDAQATRLGRERERLEAQLAEASTRDALVDEHYIERMLPMAADHVRSWIAEAQEVDLDLLLRALDVRITASKERAVIELTVLLSRLVQMLNLVTTEQTSA